MVHAWSAGGGAKSAAFAPARAVVTVVIVGAADEFASAQTVTFRFVAGAVDAAGAADEPPAAEDCTSVPPHALRTTATATIERSGDRRRCMTVRRPVRGA